MPDRATKAVTPRFVRNLRWLGRQAAVMELAAPSRRRVAYVGADDLRNVGDGASYEAYRTLLPSLRLWRHVVTADPRMLRAVRPVNRRSRLRAALLGGGTLIGREPYRVGLQRLADMGNPPLHMVGTGVEDPDYRPQRTNREQLERWGRLLARAETGIVVRGPRSAEILADVGLEATVIGDPVLTFASGTSPDGYEDGLLGINLAWFNNLWGGDSRAVIDVLVAVARASVRSGWRVRLFPMSPTDLPAVRDAAAAIGGGASIYRGSLAREPLSAALARCHVLAGERLHALVLAANASVPMIAIEYRPKCGDFMRSVDRTAYVMRTDRLDVAQLAAMVQDVGDRRDEQASALSQVVAAHRRAIEAHARRVRLAVMR